MVKINAVYDHFKGGRYRVILVAKDSNNLSETVIYQQLYHSENFPIGTFWSRSVVDFDGYKIIDGEKIKRFVEVENEK